MKNYILFLTIIIMSVSVLCGCETYHPSNAPRETVTLRSNILTTVTTAETTRADTYSEYVSSLKEAGEDNGTMQKHSEEHIRMSADTRIGGLFPDTAIQRQSTETMQRETAITRIEVIVVTTTPPDTSESEEETTSTVVCEQSEPEPRQTQTMPTSENVIHETVVPDFPDFNIGDIPPVPSGAVKADTALTNP